MIIKEHLVFSEWLADQSPMVQLLIGRRLLRVAAGNLGDAKSVGGGVSELRIHNGGWRVYYARRGPEIIILLCAGDKSDQRRDIALAKKLNEED